MGERGVREGGREGELRERVSLQLLEGAVIRARLVPCEANTHTHTQLWPFMPIEPPSKYGPPAPLPPRPH